MEKNPCSGLVTGSPDDVVLLVFALIGLLVFLGCVWAFFYAIFLFIFSKGDDAKVKSAWNSIRYMIIGLFLTVMIVFLAPTVLKYFSVDRNRNYNLSSVFNKAGKVVMCVATGVGEVLKSYPNSGFGPSGFKEVSGSSLDDEIIYEL